MYDYLIVGAGFAGAVLAERLASVAHQRVLLCDKRSHVGGNAYDYYNDDGILIHKYGPHIFHTNSAKIFGYLSQFTAWRSYQHRVLAQVDGAVLPFPINLDTINKMYGWSLTSEQLEEYLKTVAVPVETCRNLEEAVTSRVGVALYEKFFKNYTIKQWGRAPTQLDASVAARVPARTSRDDRYFQDTYQFMPLHGYSRLFQAMLSHPNIHVVLGAHFSDVKREVKAKRIIYTGPIDEYFDFCFGPLPYRSIRFEFKTLDCEVFQVGAVINYPNEHQYTRVTEFKYLTGQNHPRTTVVYEFPNDQGDPYYPVPAAENAERYRKYKALAARTSGVHFCGRLGTYRYYNMDQVVGQALALFDELMASSSTESAARA